LKLLRYMYSRVSEDLLLLALLLGFALLMAMMPDAWHLVPQLVEWHTIAILAGLMVLSRGLEDSGALRRAGDWLLRRMPDERRLALSMVLFAALLSAVVTNDVALFIIVPLTVALGDMAPLPVGRLIIFEALAVNAGSAASPIGNPQNLLLWQLSGDSFAVFFMAMLPIAGWMLVTLLLLTAFAFPARPVALDQSGVRSPVRSCLFRVSLLCYPAFLVLVEMGLIWWALAGILTLFLLLWRDVLRGVDWLILAIFVLMFVDLGLLAQLPVMAGVAEGLVALPGAEMTGAALLSQLISNVPAAIFLAAFSEQWYGLAWGVNVGGFGLAIGSLANLIALRLGRQRRLWLAFHAWSIPMLLFSLAGAYLLTAARG
jgi:Na+/H+ antiporter NhaD/arsenite permease-like protein